MVLPVGQGHVIGREMLKFTDTQMDRFRAERMRAFEAEMADHVRRFSPPLSKTLSREEILAAVRYGIARARDFGFDTRGPVRLWLENALVFGSDFDTDPQYPWVAASAGKTSALQMERAESLFRKTVEYRRTVGGDKDLLTLRALARIPSFVEHAPTLSPADFAGTLRDAMVSIYPQKAQYIGDEAIGRLIDAGVQAAEERGIFELRGQALIVVLMYAFGHGCIGDPLYPWIARTLSDEKFPDPNARAARLEVKSMIWLDHVLAYFADGTPK